MLATFNHTRFQISNFVTGPDATRILIFVGRSNSPKLRRPDHCRHFDGRDSGLRIFAERRVQFVKSFEFVKTVQQVGVHQVSRIDEVLENSFEWAR